MIVRYVPDEGQNEYDLEVETLEEVWFSMRHDGQEFNCALGPDQVAALIGQLDSWLARVQVEADE